MFFHYQSDNSPANKISHRALKRRYAEDPRLFWNRITTKSELPEFLISFAIFIFSLLSASANCELTFTRMGWMIAGRRSSITAGNIDKRLTIANQLPQKKRLLALCDERKIKRSKITKELFILHWIMFACVIWSRIIYPHQKPHLYIHIWKCTPAPKSAPAHPHLKIYTRTREPHHIRTRTSGSDKFHFILPQNLIILHFNSAVKFIT